MSINIIISFLSYINIFFLSLSLPLIFVLIDEFGHNIPLLMSYFFISITCIIILRVKSSIIQKILLVVSSLLLIIVISFMYNNLILKLSMAFANPETKNIYTFFILIFLFLINLAILSLLYYLALLSIREELKKHVMPQITNKNSVVLSDVKHYILIYTGGWIIDIIFILLLLHRILHFMPHFVILWLLAVISRMAYFFATTDKIKYYPSLRIASVITGCVTLVTMICILSLWV